MERLASKYALIVVALVSVVAGAFAGGAAALYVGNLSPAEAQNVPFIGHRIAEEKKEAAVETQKVVEQESATSAVKKAAPSVVSIVITKEVAQASGSIFDPFFDFGTAPQTGKTERREVGGGSGFIVGTDGLIVTNRHVVEDQKAEYTAVLSDGRKFPAKVLARDAVLDLALVKIEATNLPALKLGDSDKLALGETVIAIGNALGEFQNSVTKGIVSGKNRRIVAGGSAGGSEVIEEAIQTDAAINPGNSGGPLLSLSGEVVGVNTAVSQQGQSLGFAIPINLAKQSIDSVRKFGRIIRPYIGVRYVIITPELVKNNTLPVDHGALVGAGTGQNSLAVIPGSPADKAGLVENDIILEADGVRIDGEHSLAMVVGKKKVGDTLKLKIYHKGETKTVTLTLAEMPKQ